MNTSRTFEHGTLSRFLKMILIFILTIIMLSANGGIFIANMVLASNSSLNKIKSISWDFNRDDLLVGETVKSKVSIKYLSTNSKSSKLKKESVRFSSSNSKIASIDNSGKIKAIKEGRVDFTASGGGKSVVRKIVVLPKGTISVNKNSDIESVLVSSFKKYKNKSFSLNFKFLSSYIDLNNVIYKIEASDSDILAGRNIQMMTKNYIIGSKSLTLISFSSKAINSSDKTIAKENISTTPANSISNNGDSKKESAVNNKVKQIIETVIKPNMSALQKELAIHDYIVNNTKYDYENFQSGNIPYDDYTAYGVLINGTGVCQGYAEATKKLLDYVGIKNIIVSGNATNDYGTLSHAWNIVQIDGEYYQLDTTWDDPITSDGSNALRHDYFNITDQDMSLNHSWDKSQYPKCTSTKASYDNNFNEVDSYGNQFIKIKSYNEFYNTIKDYLTKGKKIISMKIYNYNDSTYNVSNAINKIVKSEGLRISGCSWVYYDESLHKENRYVTLTVK